MTSERLKGLISDAKQQTVEQVKAFPLTALAHIQGLASVLEALLVDISILRDDQKSAEATIAELKDNCRCPECGCATIDDAESSECGCDAPVCLIEVGDSLAKAYVREFELAKRLLQKNDALTAENATLRTRLSALVTAAEAFILAVDAHRDALDNLEMEESDDHAIKEIAANGVLLDSKRALSAAVAEAKGEK